MRSRVKGYRLVNKGSAVRGDKTAIDFDICPNGSEVWMKRSRENNGACITQLVDIVAASKSSTKLVSAVSS